MVWRDSCFPVHNLKLLMKTLTRTPLGALLLTLALGPSLRAADLFSESFDDELAARIATGSGKNIAPRKLISCPRPSAT
jgi:hypothetical protein